MLRDHREGDISHRTVGVNNPKTEMGLTNMIIVWTALAAVFLIVAVAVHEAAHALALRRMGIRVVELGIGMFSPRLRINAPWLPFEVSISPWLIGAYVMPDPEQEDDITALSYRDSTWYAGAGVVANFVLGSGMLAMVGVVDGKWLAASISASVAVAVWVGRRVFCAYLMPLLGVPILVWVAYTLLTNVGQPQGPIGVGALLMSSTFGAAFGIGAVISIALGLFNMVPLFPLDGGRVADSVLQRWFGSGVAGAFRTATMVLTLGLMVYAVGSDALWLAT